MGVDVKFYVVNGIKTEYKSDFVNTLYDYMDEHGDREIPFIADSMSGKYIILGNIIASAEPYEDDMFEEIDFTTLEEDSIEYKEKFRKAFPEYASLMDSPFKLFTFIHYS